MFSKFVQFRVIFLLAMIISLQGCAPSFGITEHSVWPPENYDSQNAYPGTLIISRSGELEYLAGIWEIRANLDQPAQLDSDWDGYAIARSPDGSRLAYVIRYSGQFQVRILDIQSQELEQQYSLSITPGSMIWDSNNELIFIIFRSTGEDYETARGLITPGDYGYATLDLDSGQENIYFPNWGLHESQFGGPWIAFSPLGDSALIYNETWNDELGGYYLLNWDLESGNSRWAFSPSNDFDWSPDGKSIAIIGSPDEEAYQGEEILLINSLTGDFERLTYYLDTYETVKLFGIYWSPDGRYILHWLQTDTEPGFEPDPGTLYMIDTQTGQITNLGIPYGNISDLTWSPDSKYFVFNTLDGIAVVDVKKFVSFYVYNSSLPSLIEWIIPLGDQ